MSSDSPSQPAVLLIWGEDEFTVKKRAQEVYRQWCQESGGEDHEIIDASVSHGGDALRALGKLREALQTLPFFGGAKVVWFQNCSFLGEDRTSVSQAVTENLTDFAKDLKAFDWTNVRLLISAGKVNRVRTFYKTLEKIGTVEGHEGLSVDSRDWADRAETWAARQLKSLQKEITDEALAALVSCVGPHLRQLNNEAEKLALYVGERVLIELPDVQAIVTRSKQASAFALGEALGDRHLPRLLKALDDELWEVKLGSQKTEIGLLYGLISKVRGLILLQEMLRQGLIKPENDYRRFAAQLQRLPAEAFPEDKRYNPAAMNPYVLFKALPQVLRYTSEELVRAMGLLLECNQRLVSSRLDPSLVMQHTLVQIVNPADDAPKMARTNKRLP